MRPFQPVPLCVVWFLLSLLLLQLQSGVCNGPRQVVRHRADQCRRSEESLGCVEALHILRSPLRASQCALLLLSGHQIQNSPATSTQRPSETGPLLAHHLSVARQFACSCWGANSCDFRVEGVGSVDDSFSRPLGLAPCSHFIACRIRLLDIALGVCSSPVGVVTWSSCCCAELRKALAAHRLQLKDAAAAAGDRKQPSMAQQINSRLADMQTYLSTPFRQ